MKLKKMTMAVKLTPTSDDVEDDEDDHGSCRGAEEEGDEIDEGQCRPAIQQQHQEHQP